APPAARGGQRGEGLSRLRDPGGRQPGDRGGAHGEWWNRLSEAREESQHRRDGRRGPRDHVRDDAVDRYLGGEEHDDRSAHELGCERYRDTESERARHPAAETPREGLRE